MTLRVKYASVPLSATARFRAPTRPRSIGPRKTTTQTRDKYNSFWHHSTGRWLWNNEINHEMRYTPINVDGLKSVACQVASARHCTKMIKLGEGSFNKVFLLQFDNGEELVARIPCPLVGNLSVVTASEAATMEYVRLRYKAGGDDLDKFPRFPRVLAWSSSFENPVEWPYILAQHIFGVDLQSRWYSISGPPVKKAVLGVVSFETTILKEAFSQHGSLYFTEDVNGDLRERPLYAEPPNDPLRVELSRKFRIGPIATREWWRGAYGQVPADRGPWPNLPSIISSAAEFQLRCLEKGIGQSSPFVKSTAYDIPLIRRLLKMCISIAPHIIPEDPYMTRPVLRHPDLSRGNLIVPPEGDPIIEGIIDWQGAAVAPFFTQSDTAPAFRYEDGLIEIASFMVEPPWPADFDSMSPAEQERIRMHHRLACRHVTYRNVAAKASNERFASWLVPGQTEIGNLLIFIPRCIADGPVDLFGILLSLQKDWHLLSAERCPIDFSPEEQEVCRIQGEATELYRKNMQDVLVAVGCSDDGWVAHERFDMANDIFEECRRAWKENETEMKSPFPFFDGSYGQLLT